MCILKSAMFLTWSLIGWQDSHKLYANYSCADADGFGYTSYGIIELTFYNK